MTDRAAKFGGQQGEISAAFTACQLSSCKAQAYRGDAVALTFCGPIQEPLLKSSCDRNKMTRFGDALRNVSELKATNIFPGGSNCHY